MGTTWTIAIDWERTGSFDGEYDDVTERVLDANWFLGLKRPYEDIAHDSVLQLSLQNQDRLFSPEAGGALSNQLVPFRPVIIQSYDGTTTCTHWKGWIETIQPQVNQFGERTVKIVAAGPMQFMKAADTNLALQENQRTDQIIAELLTKVVYPPALAGVFILGFSRLGLDTYLADTSGYSDLDEGLQTLTIAADNWVRQGNNPGERESFNVYQAIADVTAAERGRFLFNREGKAVFWNRHRLLYASNPAAIFDDSMQNLEYVYGSPDELKNEIIVVCHPRSISATTSELLWSLDREITVRPGEARKLTARYRDESGNRIGGRGVGAADIVFSAGTATIEVEANANSAEVIITNTGSGNATLTGLSLRGEKITDFGRMEAKATDEYSITKYGRRTLRLNLPAVDNLDDADDIAHFELNRRKEPRGSVRQLNLTSHGLDGGGHHAQQVARTLGDKIRVSETQTQHEDDYYIIGEQHRLSKGATLLETTWYLEPATAGFWTLGVSTLDNNTVLAY